MWKKCPGCSRWLHKIRGAKRVVRTQHQANRYQEILGVAVSINDKICSHCWVQRIEEPAVGEAASFDSQAADEEREAPENRSEGQQFIINWPRTAFSHARCFACDSTGPLRILPFDSRRLVFHKTGVFVPKESRSCLSHLVTAETSADVLQGLPIAANWSSVSKEEITTFLSTTPKPTLYEAVGQLQVPDSQLKALTGFDGREFVQIMYSVTSIRATSSWNPAQAMLIFLYKLRTGNSNEIIANTFELHSKQAVSTCFNLVLEAFKNVTATEFGPTSLTRSTLLENTTATARQLFRMRDDQVALIMDGTYIRHQKSSNNSFQRRSFSGQKKVPLCKPFTICTTNGLIVDFAGPFSGTANDAAIVKEVLKDSSLRSLLKPGDLLIVDRGFRDAVPAMESLGFKVLMPAMKGKRKQVPTEEANASRRVTKVRWVVEAVHGIVGQRYGLLHHAVDNKLLPKVEQLCDIVGFLQNKFGRRCWADGPLAAQILESMERREHLPNTLVDEVELKRWNRRPTTFQKVSASAVTDFPKLTETQLLLLCSGPYQLRQALSYLGELMDIDGSVSIGFIKETRTIVRLEMKSRHVNRTTYRLYIDYDPLNNSIDGIRRYCCECPNGARTVGCCSHVATALFYLSFARFQTSIRRPAAALTRLFLPSAGASDDDDAEDGEDEADGEEESEEEGEEQVDSSEPSSSQSSHMSSDN